MADAGQEALIAPENAKAGFRGLVGFRLVEWREGMAVAELDLAEQHLNSAGVLHGGAIATLIDATCGYAMCWSGVPGRPRPAVTLSLTVSYTGQVTQGLVRAHARLKAGGRRITFCSADVLAGDGTLIAMGEGTFRYRSAPAEV